MTKPLDGSQFLCLLANPVWTHSMGESGKNTITVGATAGEAHLDHGDTTGACPDAPVTASIGKKR
jgi:hypothetical protein